jgi:hypothetical protein
MKTVLKYEMAHFITGAVLHCRNFQFITAGVKESLKQKTLQIAGTEFSWVKNRIQVPLYI